MPAGTRLSRSQAVQCFSHRVEQIRQCPFELIRIRLISGYCIDQYTADNYTIGYPTDRCRCCSVTNTKSNTHRKRSQFVNMGHLRGHFIHIDLTGARNTLE